MSVGKFWRESHLIERVVMIGGAAAMIFFGGYLYRSQNQTDSLPPLFHEAPKSQFSVSKLSSSTGRSNASGHIKVHVVGAVVKAGVFVLPANARVGDAIRVAGGVTKNGKPDALNLAAHLEDGQQIRVPTQSETVMSFPTTGVLPSESSAIGMVARRDSQALHNTMPARSRKQVLPTRPININAASAAELDSLPGIGPALAARILSYRAQHGRFNSLDELDSVSGIGPKKLENLRPYITY